MADENIEIGGSPSPEPSAPIEETIAVEATSSSEAPSSGPSGPTGRHLEVDAETSEKMFDLFGTALKRTDFGYKQLQGPMRDAGHRTMAATEHVFAHVMAVDPERAMKMWTDLNGRPPSAGILQSAQNIPLRDPKVALDSLTTQVDKAGAQVSELNTQNKENELRKQRNSMQGPHGDAVARGKEYGSSLIDNMLPQQHNQADSGMFILKAFTDAVKQASKASQMVQQKRRAGDMGKELASLDKELKVIDSGKAKMEGGRLHQMRETMGTMGINVSKSLKIEGIGAAVKAALTKPKTAGIPVTAQSIAAQQSQSQGLGIGS
jgi:hypothetical protein